MAAELAVVKDGGVAVDVPRLREAINPSLRCSRGETDEAADLACRSPAILHEQLKDALIKSVENFQHRSMSVTPMAPATQIFAEFMMVTRKYWTVMRTGTKLLMWRLPRNAT